MSRKFFSFVLIGLVLILGFGAAALLVGAASSTPITGLHWVEYHDAGALYPVNFSFSRALYYTTTVQVEMHGLDLSKVTCANNWDNTVVLTPTVGLTNTYQIVITGTGKYVGASANIQCGYAPVTASYSGYTKIGFYTMPTSAAATVTYLTTQENYMFPGSWNYVNVNVRVSDGTNFVITTTNTTDLEAFIGDLELNASCSDSTCTINAPKGALFSEVGYIVNLKFYAADVNMPFGLVLPVPPTPTPTATPVLTPTPTP